MKLRAADSQDRTLAALTPGGDVQITLTGRLVEVFHANGQLCFVIDTPAGRITVTPIRDGSQITPTHH